MAHSNTDFYHTPVVRGPTRDDIKNISDSMGFTLTEHELEALEDATLKSAILYDKLYQIKEELPVTKYPRLSGYKPSSDENPYNAWYYKTDIKGASSGKLYGKTVAIKDSIAVAGVPLMAGSVLLEGYVPEYDATVVTRILDAGGCIKGKAACEDMCSSGNSYTCNTGCVLNFHDQSRSSGGSSSGCGTLVASGEVDMAVGGDQSGSIRIPASWSGIAGLKPTWGLVPHTGALGADPTIDYVGPMAKSVYDCALLLEVIAGSDGCDGRQKFTPDVPNYTEHLTGDLNGIKIGLLKEGFELCHKEVAEVVQKAASKLSSKGAIIENVSIPMHKDSQTVFNPISIEGYYQCQYGCKGTNFGMMGFQPSSMIDFLSKSIASKPNHLPLRLKFRYIMGNYMKGHYGHHYYMKAQNLIRTLSNAYDKVLEKYDVLLMPTNPCTAKKNPPPDLTPKEHFALLSGIVENTVAFNMTGHPALSANAGFSSENLPVGMMVVARHFDDVTALRVGHAYEQIRDL